MLYFKMVFIFLILFLSLIFNMDVYSGIYEGKLKSQICSPCHGEDGNNIIGIWPKLAGQHKNYIIKQLIEFKLGQIGNRFDPVMFGITQNLTNDDINDIAEYYSNNSIFKTEHIINNDLFEYGMNIYKYGNIDKKITACISCHNIYGTGNYLANFPSLKWQHKEYIEKQINNFLNKDRKNDMMHDISLNMSNNDIEAVSIYIANMN